MTQLVFALILQTYADGKLESTVEMGVWENLDSCIYFSRQINNQRIGNNKLPILTYCAPKRVDPSEVQIF